MLVEVRVPVLAESVAEATLMDWHKQPGDPVKFGDTLIDIETDKVTLEIVAPEDGVLLEILKNGGEDVSSNELIAQIDTDADATVTAAAPETPSAVPEEQQPDEAGEQEPVSATAPATETVEEAAQQSLLPEEENTEQSGQEDEQAATSTKAAPKLSPAVRNLLREHNLNAEDIPITGDRITKKAVLEFLQQGDEVAVNEQQETENREQQTPVAQPEPAVAAEQEPTPVAKDTTHTPASAKGGADTRSPLEGEKRVPMTRLRRRAAERLLAAQQENAILTTFNELNMKPVMDLRRRYKDSFENTHNIKLGFMSFFTKAAVEALKKFPVVNAAVDGADIIYHDYFDIGIAVSSPRGLVVPVLRGADQLGFAEIEKTIGEFGQKARDAKLAIEDLTGGTFTITNGGVFGSLLSTPIINPPQSAILGMHKIEERPVAEDGAVVIRPMMYLALSYDHRIIDGREAVSFLVAIKEALEDPSRLLLQI